MYSWAYKPYYMNTHGYIFLHYFFLQKNQEYKNVKDEIGDRECKMLNTVRLLNKEEGISTTWVTYENGTIKA